MKVSKNSSLGIIPIMIAFGIFFPLFISALNSFIDYSSNNDVTVNEYGYNSNFYSSNAEFKIISSDENKDLEDDLMEFARSHNYHITIDYAGTLDIMDKLNSGEEYDAVWASNSIWLYMLKSDVKIKNSKSTSINPVVFAVRRSKAYQLGFVSREIYTKDIVEAIQNGSLSFSMSNPTQTNSGATAYLGLLSTLVGNPEVLKEEMMEDPIVKENLKLFFSNMDRSSGDETYLEQVFLNGSSDAVVAYEASIIKINQDSSMTGDPLYALYPVDGVSISDSPFAYIDKGEEEKENLFLEIRNFLTSKKGQKLLQDHGRRTWYGGINNSVDRSIFNPNWGIDTTKYITPIKFPNTEVIQKALSIYQSELRKPVHTVFCLDYSGSMSGSGNQQLVAAMEYLFSVEAEQEFIQYTDEDKISVIPFNGEVREIWKGYTGDIDDTNDLLRKIRNMVPTGATNIYDSSVEALKILYAEDRDKYNTSVILMTDGNSNNGSLKTLSNYYNMYRMDIPVFSIMFGSAYVNQLEEIADLTNGKVFDGRTDLLKAFKEVRGYN